MIQALLPFWPSREERSECIDINAESLSEAVLQAVHQPIYFRRELHTGRGPGARNKTERDLINEFMRPDAKTLLLPIQGSSGIGKSHMIRRMEMELMRREEAEKLHIIRIPRSSSLRRVLDLVVKDLHGSVYDDIKQRMKEAHAELSQSHARAQLRTNLELVLEQKSHEAQPRIELASKEKSSPDNLDLLFYRHGKKENLPSLLKQYAFDKHFMDEENGVFTKILRRATTGGEQGDEEENFQISAEELRFEPEIIKQSEKSVQSYYRKHIIKKHTRADGTTDDGFDDMAIVLNAVVDDAMGMMLHFRGESLHELFRRIREGLFADGKELILLIEDFAVMAGIQRELLDITVEKAVTDGKQVLCTMRTAMAVTEGYLTNKDTIRTRAEATWHIEDNRHGELDNVLDAVREFVGAYLNAMRVGKNKLEKLYAENRYKPGNKWVPVFSPALLDGTPEALTNTERDILTAFGKTKRGYSLFPYSSEMLDELMLQSQEYKDDELIFNPRTIIHRILNDVLELRTEFENGVFPPEDCTVFSIDALSSDIGRIVGDLCPDPTKQWRYKAILRYWGGKPERPSEIEAPKSGVYEAFGLEVPSWNSIGIVPIKDRVKSKQRQEDKRQTVITSSEQKKTDVEQKIDALSNWRESKGEVPLDRRLSMELRQTIAKAIKASFDWEVCLLACFDLSQTYYFNWVHIPCARGGEPSATHERSLASLGTDEDMMNNATRDRIHDTLRAITRYHLQYNSWEYSEAMEDFAVYTNFLTEANRQATKFVKTNYFETRADILPAAAEALMVGAAVLGIEGAFKHAKAEVISAALKPVTLDDYDTIIGKEKGKWGELKAKSFEARLSSQNEIPSVLDLTLNLCSARVSGGRTVQAIDAVALWPLLSQARKNWDIEKRLSLGGSAKLQKIRVYTSYLANKYPGIRNQRARELQTRWKQIKPLLGQDFAPHLLCQELEKLLQKATLVGAIPREVKVKELEDTLNETAKLRKEYITDLEALDADAPPDLRHLVAIRECDVVRLERLAKQFGEFLDRLAISLETQKEQSNRLDPERKAERLIADINSIARLYERIDERRCK
jgi:hypothetical protein